MKVVKLFILTIVVALLSLSGGTAVAGNAKGEFSNFSAGTYSCARILKHEKEDGWPHLVDWAFVAGFMSGTSLHVPTDELFHNITDMHGVWHLVRDYCEKNPIDTLGGAADYVAGQLIDRAGRR